MIKVIICCFNLDYKRIELLKVCLYSIYKHTPFQIVVYHNDLSEEITNEISVKLKRICFIHMPLKIVMSMEIASQKMVMWEDIIKKEKEDSKIIFSDLDTLYLKDISNAFDTIFDIGYTCKDDPSLKYPLNTGIVFIRVNKRSREALYKWKEITDKILQDKEKSEEAINTFGGADQRSLSILIGRDKDFLGVSSNNDLIFFGFKASLYNIHKDWSNPYSGGGMIHFKSCWKDVLLNNSSFDEAISIYNETLKNGFLSWRQSYLLWKKYHSEYYSI
jgi:hypothetical protein